MKVLFELSMPNCGSWNGKWSGAERCYAIIRSFRTKAGKIKAQELIKKSYYYYNFGDGWGAGVTVSDIDDKIARQKQRKSCGFAGYDWMVDSIIDYGEILNTEQRKEHAIVGAKL